MVTQEFDLNLIPSSEPVVVHVNQYDYGSGRFIISLWEGSTEYTPESGTTVLIEGHKPDGNVFSYGEADGVSLTENVVTAPCLIQMTAVEGRTRVNLILSNSGTRIGSFVFWLDVQETPVNEEAPVSETEIPAIIALAESQAERAESAADTAVEAASEAETSATQAQASQSAAYISEINANGYASEAEQSATAASGSATAASGSATSASESKENAEAWAVGTKNGTPVPETAPQYDNHAKYWAEQAQAVADIHLMDNNTTGIGKPDTFTAEATNGTFSAIGTTIVGTVNPSGTEYGSNWLLDSDSNVITPDFRRQYRVQIGNKTQLYFWTGTEYKELGSSGHVIYGIKSSILPIAGSVLPMAGRAGLEFDGVGVEDDPVNDRTIIKPQIRICETEAEWNLKSEGEKNNPLIYWYLPWATENVYASDKTPVGTVITVATGKTGDGITGITTPTNPFPSNNYLICNGDEVSLTEYPQLADYFEERYGSKFYFNTGGLNPNNGKFKLPTWSADYPENGILCIKARITSDVITFAEVDETGESARTDEVPSCARVAALETISTVTDYTAITNNNYALSRMSVKKHGKLVVIQGEITVSTAEDTHPGIKVLSGLPVPTETTYIPLPSRDLATNKSIRMILNTSGDLFLRYGTVGYYDLYIMYLSA